MSSPQKAEEAVLDTSSCATPPQLAQDCGSPPPAAPAAVETSPQRRPESRSLSVDAPAFRPGPHTVTLFAPADQRSVVTPCDLATLTIADLVVLAANGIGMAPESVCLTFTGMRLDNLAAKAIDVGISNQAVVLVHHKGSEMQMPEPLCPPVMPTVEEQLRMQQAATVEEQLRMQQAQMAQYSAALQRNQAAQMQLAAMAGIPLIPMQQQAMHERDEMPEMPGDMLFGGPPVRQVVPEMPLQQPCGTSPLATVSPQQGTTITRVIIAQPPPALPAAQRPAARPCGSINLNANASEFCTYAFTNEGSRALVSALETLPEPAQTIDLILDELAGSSQFPSMATHQHGSKVLRALTRRLSGAQSACLLRLTSKDIVELAESTSGSDVLTEIIARAGDAAEAAGFCTAMAPEILRICVSVNARKVLLAALQHFSAAAVEPIYDALGAQLLNAATDQCGCITLQRVLDYTHNVRWKTQLQMQILEAVMYLITDPYGNYVLQHAVKDEPYCSQVVAEKVSGKLVDFACNKFASNVVERCLQIGPEQTRNMLIEEACSPAVLDVLMQDAYGNFVVQSSVDNAPPHLLDRIRTAVAPLVGRSPYGYRIESKLQRRLKRGRGSRHSQHDQQHRPVLQQLSANNSAGQRGIGKAPPPTAVLQYVQQQQQPQVAY